MHTSSSVEYIAKGLPDKTKKTLREAHHEAACRAAGVPFIAALPAVYASAPRRMPASNAGSNATSNAGNATAGNAAAAINADPIKT